MKDNPAVSRRNIQYLTDFIGAKSFYFAEGKGFCYTSGKLFQTGMQNPQELFLFKKFPGIGAPLAWTLFPVALFIKELL